MMACGWILSRVACPHMARRALLLFCGVYRFRGGNRNHNGRKFYP